MPLTGDDMPWLAKVAYSAVSFIGGALAASFTMGVRMSKRDALNTKRDEKIRGNEERIKAVETKIASAHETQTVLCEKRWADVLKLQDDAAKLIGERICASVRQMISDSKSETEDDLTEIKISLATIIEKQKSTDELSALLKAILERGSHS